jgi:hypothetical protein
LHVLNIRSSLKYQMSAFNEIEFNFLRLPGLVSILDFLPLDDSNPLQLQAGNFDLKIPVMNEMTLKTNLMVNGSTLEVKATYRLDENSLVERSHYYRTPTFLPEFNYTTVAGARLLTKENVTGSQLWSVGVNYSAYLGESIIQVNPIYTYRTILGYIEEELLNSYQSRYHLNAKWIGNFSTKLSPSISTTSIYTTRSNVYAKNNAFTQNIVLELKAMIASRFEMLNTNTLNWTSVSPEIQKIDRFGAVSNLSVSYLIDQTGKLKVKAELNDLFNRKQRVSMNVFDEYTSTNFNFGLGRYFATGFYWEF